jgi:hypothetical protein
MRVGPQGGGNLNFVGEGLRICSEPLLNLPLSPDPPLVWCSVKIRAGASGSVSGVGSGAPVTGCWPGAEGEIVMHNVNLQILKPYQYSIVPTLYQLGPPFEKRKS